MMNGTFNAESENRNNIISISDDIFEIWHGNIANIKKFISKIRRKWHDYVKQDYC